MAMTKEEKYAAVVIVIGFLAAMFFLI